MKIFPLSRKKVYGWDSQESVQEVKDGKLRKGHRFHDQLAILSVFSAMLRNFEHFFVWFGKNVASELCTSKWGWKVREKEEGVIRWLGHESTYVEMHDKPTWKNIKLEKILPLGSPIKKVWRLGTWGGKKRERTKKTEKVVFRVGDQLVYHFEKIFTFKNILIIRVSYEKKFLDGKGGKHKKFFDRLIRVSSLNRAHIWRKQKNFRDQKSKCGLRQRKREMVTRKEDIWDLSMKSSLHSQFRWNLTNSEDKFVLPSKYIRVSWFHQRKWGR